MKNVLFLLVIGCSGKMSFAQNWQTISEQTIDGGVYVLYDDTATDALIVGGDFSNIDGHYGMRSIAMWQGGQWHELAAGLSSFQWPASVRAIIRYQGDLYAGGYLGGGDVPYSGIARWDGSEWLPVGNGLFGANGAGHPGIVNNFRVIGDELFVCGNFRYAGNHIVNGLAKWNGSEWSDVHGFPFFHQDSSGNFINDCIVYNGELHVGGAFYTVGGGGRQGVIKWNGSEWVALGNGIGATLCLAEYEGKLFAGGAFVASNPNFPENHISSWDGDQWNTVGGGVTGALVVNGDVHDMLVFQGKLFAVGAFEYAGGILAKRIATWDGHEWCDLGGGECTGRVFSITTHGDTVYVGGGFTELGGTQIRAIAKSGGGDYEENCGATTGISEIGEGSQRVSIHPNPTSGLFTITSIKPLLSVSVVDMLGRVLLSERGEFSNSKAIDLSHLPTGIYVVHVETEVGRHAQRVVRE